jgi:hypothetical protein
MNRSKWYRSKQLTLDCWEAQLFYEFVHNVNAVECFSSDLQSLFACCFEILFPKTGQLMGARCRIRKHLLANVGQEADDVVALLKEPGQDTLSKVSIGQEK